MNKNTNTSTTDSGRPYSGARPMKVHIDQHGNEWLCDAHVEADSDFGAQGCWRTDTMAFNRND